ncbi:MAG: carboxymuconolactone decarboxylase family protein [Myxococcota bacterium]
MDHGEPETAQSRLQPLTPPFSEQVASLLARYPSQGGYLLALFRVFANSPRFLAKGVTNLLDDDSPLSLRTRELVILRVTANRDCEYEWGVHVAVFARRAGLSDAEVRATRLGSSADPGWSEEDRLAIRVVDELCADARISDETARDVAALWSAEQQLEVLALCGNYQTVCFVANSAQLPPEPFAARFPRTDS